MQIMLKHVVRRESTAISNHYFQKKKSCIRNSLIFSYNKLRILLTVLSKYLLKQGKNLNFKMARKRRHRKLQRPEVWYVVSKPQSAWQTTRISGKTFSQEWRAIVWVARLWHRIERYAGNNIPEKTYCFHLQSRNKVGQHIPPKR